MNLQQAQHAHSAAATALAQLQGKQEAFKAAHDASESYIQGLREDLDAHFQADEDEPPPKRRRSTIIDHIKKDHYAHLEEASQHCQNALIQDAGLSHEVAAAQDREVQTFELMEAAKARVTTIDHIWEAKIHREEVLRTQKKYRDLEKKIRELEEEMTTVGDELYAKTKAAGKWNVIAQNEDWEGILAEE
ncbi:phosphoethanolamine n-methyltransferase 1 [Fusarium beomiforme]|uniref:Phosphoethanolamine n-methyltransferase 1 n=1 Tax=Fusarium beomiforme TaxID=44412 RepID=A0A9P5A802_9HYPO|nr:phosphoethanolamine n-methyltransferase 1 [Fusarium beomiforme]